MGPSGLQNAEAKARAAEATIRAAKSGTALLEVTIKTAELYLRARQYALDRSDQQRLDAKCKSLLAQGEKIKDSLLETTFDAQKVGTPQDLRTRHPKAALKAPVSLRKLTTREEIILLEGCKLNGFVFPIWTEPPQMEDFQFQDGQEMFVDTPRLQLSDSQLKSFAGWKRPREALSHIEIEFEGKLLPNEPTMKRSAIVDLVQDMTSDCSVVASLCAGTARAEKGHPRILSTIVYPYNHEEGAPAISSNGKYVLRLHFNGCDRKVVIDDFLPVSKNSRILHVIDRSNPGCLWPALVEKGYLKIRGGYDFPGSNSGTDIAVLTGWIPEQIFLQDEDVMPEELWNRVFDGFSHGNVLLTIGTGKLSTREQRQLGLAGEHDYAILDLQESKGLKEMLIKNPWSDGDVWTGATRQRPHPASTRSSHVGLESSKDAMDLHDSDLRMTPGTFWMDLGSIFQHFDNLYLNWNPNLFQHRADHHFTWHLPTSNTGNGTFANNPQFAVTSSSSGEVWLLLNKHFKTGDYSADSKDNNGFVSLYVFSNKGQRLLLSDGAMFRGPYVDSPNTMVTLYLQAEASYTAVVASQDLPAGKYNFTLSAFSQSLTQLSPADAKYLSTASFSAAWTRSTSGGSSESTEYLTNPQFALSVSCRSKVAILLTIDKSSMLTPEDVHVKLLILFTNGSRVTTLRNGDIVAQSGNYRNGSTAIETTLDKGTYTIICSTFEKGQYAKFTLTAYTSSTDPCVLRALPAEGSGRLSILSSPAVFIGGTNRLLAPLKIPRLTKCKLIARYVPSQTPRSLRLSAPSLLKISLEQGQGPYKACLITSATNEHDYHDAVAGVRLGDIDLSPDLHMPGSGGLWLVVERLGGPSSASLTEELVQVEMLTEERIELGPWGRGDG